MNKRQPILSLRGVQVRFGGLLALDIKQIEMLDASGVSAIFMGPNGAGKSTLYGALTGYVPVSRGSRITLNDGKNRELVGRSRAAVVRCGIARTHQSPVFFPSLTVREGMLLSTRMTRTCTWIRRRLSWLDFPGRNGRSGRLVDELIACLELDAVADTRMARLTLPLLRRAEIGRCMATQPRVVLLDEPSAGAALGETAFLVQCLGSVLPGLVRRLHSEGLYRHPQVAIGVITHDLVLAEGLAKANGASPVVHVLNQGRLLMSASLDQVVGDARVQDIYLARR